jgi:hypothetical protein
MSPTSGSDHLTIETAAWLAEINDQLTDLAEANEIEPIMVEPNWLDTRPWRQLSRPREK